MAKVYSSESSKLEAKEKKEQNESAAKLFGGITKSFLGTSIGNLMSNSSGEQQKKSISVVVTLQSNKMADQEKISETVKIERNNLHLDVDEKSVIHDALWEGITQAAEILYSKLTNIKVVPKKKETIKKKKTKNSQTMDNER